MSKVVEFQPILGGQFTVENANEIINSINALYDLLDTIYSQDLVFNTFAEVMAYTFRANKPVAFTVKIDESKSGRTNTFYKWTGEVLKWTPEVDDNFQPTI